MVKCKTIRSFSCIAACALISSSACLLMLLVVIYSSTALAQHSFPPEVWIQMRKMYRDKMPETTIDEEIASLSSRQEARQAGPKLIDRGPVILPAIHKAVLDPEVEPYTAIALFHIIQAMEDIKSTSVILALLRRNPGTPLKRDALLTLAKLPATDEAAEYILKLASDEDQPWRIRRMAYSWFALQRDTRGRPFAMALLEDKDTEIRATGLYVLAKLGDASALEPITELLTQGAPANMRNALLGGLSELVPPDEFIKRAPKGLEWSNGYKFSLSYSRYLSGDENEKSVACRELIGSNLPGHLKAAVRCFLESGQADDLRPLAALSLEAPGSDALIRNEIRKAGWRIVDTENDFRIEPTEQGDGIR